MVACASIRPNGLTTRALEELEQENARLKKLGPTRHRTSRSCGRRAGGRITSGSAGSWPHSLWPRAELRRRVPGNRVGGCRSSSPAACGPPIRRESGYVESFNRTLRDELLDGEILDALHVAQVLPGRWRKQYNTEADGFSVRAHRSRHYRLREARRFGAPLGPPARAGRPSAQYHTATDSTHGGRSTRSRPQRQTSRGTSPWLTPLSRSP